MNITMLVLAIIMVIIGGFIAYFGDLIGRRMGRKRLSLFGLRPKYTAIIISVGMGMLIPLITLGIASALSKDIRETIIKPIEEWRKESRETQTILKSTRNELKNAQKEASTVELDLSNVKKLLNSTTDDRKRIENELSSVNDTLQTREKERQRIESELRTARLEYNAVRSDLFFSRKEVLEKEQVLINLQKELNTINEEINQLEELRDRLTVQNENLRRENERLTREINGMYAELLLNLSSPLIYSPGDEVISGLIDKKEPIEPQIAKLLNMIDKIIRTINTTQSGLSIFDKNQDTIIFLERSGEQILTYSDKEKAINEIASVIKKSPAKSEVVIQIFSEYNVFGPAEFKMDNDTYILPEQGTAIIFEPRAVKVVENKQLFKEGELVVSLNKTIKESDTIAKIVLYLGDELMPELITKLQDMQVPNIMYRFDLLNPTTIPSRSGGFTIDWRDMIDTAEKARSMGGNVTYIINAVEDLDTFSLKLFELDVISR